MKQGSNSTSNVPESLGAIIVGAGFAGLYMLHSLRSLGMSCRIIEAGSGVGGTWFWNRYPGARCDADSVFYSYSFDEELDQEWTWTERCASQPEILSYLNHVADRFDLRRDVEFDSMVVAATFDDAVERWTVTTDRGREYSAKYCIMATGCLSDAKRPDLPGLEEFRAEMYHTARWPSAGVDVTGKRVGVIGTGSSGVQAIPRLAKDAEHLYVFQRTANFVLLAQNHPLSADYVESIKSDYPRWRERARRTRGGIPIELPTTSALVASPEQRLARFEKGWQFGGLGCMTTSYNDVSTDLEANALVAEFVREKIRTTVQDSDTADRLTPFGFPFGSKRTPVGIDYLETYNRDNVTLVDITAEPITQLTADAVVMGDTSVQLDVLVLATGFDAFTGPLLKMDVRGRSGVRLEDAWADGAKAYLGVQVAGFPNLFLITGPGSPSVLGNVVVCIEQHVEWITDVITYLEQVGASSIEATDGAQEDWVAHVREEAEKSLISQGNSWYSGANVSGKPRVFLPYVPGIVVFRDICDRVAANDYDGFEIRARSYANVGTVADTP